MGASLGMQCLNDIVAGLLLAWLMAMDAPALTTLEPKLLFGVVAGAVGAYGMLAAYCNWYGFSAAYAHGTGFDSLVAAAIGAFVIAKIAK